ncbi:protein KHNYN [Esox lucius]|uniref:RNase NYN domain-containing protein n=1 Tax=Esox lucius TaxID=8010 RepID=A0AAY5K3W1_ESOLU|nr:protein KHNYN [Esox lucius]
MASALSHLSQMTESWIDRGVEGEEQVEDEFACSGALRGALQSFQPLVERIFWVSFTIGRDEDAVLPHDGQIWLKMIGGRKDVESAKLFVKGVVNQEAQQEVPYPGFLHCVFCGARGLFTDCLIRNTSAHIVVGSPGFLLISGLAEPVVRAYSLITDLVERHEGTQGRRTEPGDRGLGETLDSRRAFKSLVERWEDRHTLDLLVLPGAVKETLLDLVRESGPGSNLGHRGLPGNVSNPVLGLPSNLGLGSSWDRVGAMDTANRRLWDSPSSTAGLTFTDTRLGDARDIQGISTTKPNISSQDPGPRNTEQLSQQMFSTPPVQSREVSRAKTPVAVEHRAAPKNPIFHSPPQTKDIRGRAEGAEEVAEEEQGEVEEEEEEETELLLSVGSREEFRLLLKFFTAMGYAEDVVLRVLARTGPKEASQILDLVQQEQDRSGVTMNRPVEMEHREGENRGEEGGAREGRGKRSMMDGRMEVEVEGNVEEGVRSKEVQREGRSGEEDGNSTAGNQEPHEEAGESGEANRESGEGGNDEDFVLGVLKRAAASCGYTEEKVAEVYSTFPELSTRQLLLKLQRGGAKETSKSTDSLGRVRDEPREVDEVVSEVLRNTHIKEEKEVRAKETEAPAQPSTARERVEIRSAEGKPEKKTDVPNRTADVPVKVPDLAEWNTLMTHIQPPQTYNQPAKGHKPHQVNSPLVRGPPQPTYPPKFPSPPTYTPELPPQPNYPPTFHHPMVYPLAQSPRTTLSPALTLNNSPVTKVKEKPGPLPVEAERTETWGFPKMAIGAMVTGQQRFLEGLQTPFDLKLTDQPGDPSLRMVIIDGSNVAMSHGLGHFFSCRGIALAVQHFWNRGHRRISTIIPQWRQKRDPRIKEQRYLIELQDLGLLSYTPSREVQGKRINSYDDRFMLQLAQKTDGVILTNDNLRDLLDESHVWRDIIKKSLLQYTFVGDHFMVPDDPLGRGGPHLDDFLRSQSRPPVLGSHTFAGVASPPFPSTKVPRARTDVLQFRERTPGAAVDPESSQAQSRRRGKRQAKAKYGDPGMGHGLGVQRSELETSRLMESLCQVFPGQENMVSWVLQCNPTATDINSLSDIILEQQTDSEDEV